MEVTCWRCCAVYDPGTTGKRCPHCGRHSEAWLAKLHFAAIDFAGPGILVCVGLAELHDDPVFAALFIVGSLAWAGFVYFEDVGDWVDNPAALPSKPTMPDSWKKLSAGPSQTQSEPIAAASANDSSDRSPVYLPSGLSRANLVVLGLVAGLIAYVVLRWSEIENFILHGRFSISNLLVPGVILCVIVLAVWKSRRDDQILRDGVLTPGILIGWYDKSSYSKSGYHSYIRIRYQFWTDSGQKFEGSGTLSGEPSIESLSIQQEPLKVFYLPQNPGKNVALCCTASREPLYDPQKPENRDFLKLE